MIMETRAGEALQSDGSSGILRVGRNGSAITGDGQGRYYEQTSRGRVFSLTLTATTATPISGQTIAAGAAPTVQFALWNPPGSGKRLGILKFGVAIISGTTPVSGLWHAGLATCPTIATSVITPIACNSTGQAAATVARAATHASTGVALTGASAPTLIRLADVESSAGTFANLMQGKTIEYVESDITIDPGSGWLPLWASTGTSFLMAYSVTWEEIPV